MEAPPSGDGVGVAAGCNPERFSPYSSDAHPASAGGVISLPTALCDGLEGFGGKNGAESGVGVGSLFHVEQFGVETEGPDSATAPPNGTSDGAEAEPEEERGALGGSGSGSEGDSELVGGVWAEGDSGLKGSGVVRPTQEGDKPARVGVQRVGAGGWTLPAGGNASACGRRWVA